MSTFDKTTEAGFGRITGSLIDIQTQSEVSNGTVELWYKGALVDVLLGTATSKGDGTFTIIISVKDATYIMSRAAGCRPLFFVKVHYGGEVHESFCKVDGQDDMPAREFKFPEDGDVESFVLEVMFKSTDAPYNQIYRSFRLVDLDGNPLRNRRIAGTLKADGTIVVDLGQRNTDGRGYFSLSVAETPDLAIATIGTDVLTLRVELFYTENDDISSSVEVVLDEEFSEYMTMDVPIDPMVKENQSVTIADLSSETGKVLSDVMTTHLELNGLDSLKSIREAGFIDPSGFGGPEVEEAHWLNAHARLELTAANLKMKDFYIEQGYVSLQKVAGAVRSEFVRDGAEFSEDSDLSKATMHRVATAQHQALLNVVTGLKLGVRGVFKNAEYSEKMGNGHDAYCNCSDCEAAVSPLAYLADLLKYTIGHVKKDNSFVTIDQLESELYQPFGSLPADCEEMAKKICQYRIAVEILRAYKDDLLPITGCQATNLTTAEIAYRNSAYFHLLELLGTSYDELRKASAVPYAERTEKLKPLADRLGIGFDLNLEIHSVNTTNDTITVNGNYASEILRLGTFDVVGGSDIDRNYTVVSGQTVSGMYDAANDRTTIEVNEDITTADASGTVLIDTIARLFLDVESEENTEEVLELIFGLRNSHRAPLDDQPTPEILGWQLNFFREQWAKEDHPSDPYSNGEQPIIDPDLIGIDDFRNPNSSNLGSGSFAIPGAAYDRWWGRRNWIENAVYPVLKKTDYWTPKGIVIGDRKFQINGVDVSAFGVLIGDQFIVSGSTNNVNDGVYTVQHITTGITPTLITVGEQIPDSSVHNGTVEILTRYPILSATSPNQLVVNGDASHLDDSDSITVRSSLENYGLFTVASPAVESGGQTTITVDEEIQDAIGDGFIETKQTFSISSITESGDVVNVTGTSQDQTDLDNADTITISESTENDGKYTISSVGALSNGFIPITLSDSLVSNVSDGKVSFEATVEISGIGLGARTIIVANVDLSNAIADNEEFTVIGSSLNGGPYHANGVPTYVNGASRIVVDESLNSSEANGYVKVAFSVGDLADPGANDLTINDTALSQVVSVGDIITIDETGVGVVSYTVTAISDDGTDTILTLDGASGATIGDDVFINLPITGIDISGKYFEVSTDQRGRIFSGQEIVINDSPENNGFYTVERVTTDQTSCKIYVVEPIETDAPTGVNPEIIKFTRTIDVTSSKPQVTDLFSVMSNAGSENEGDIAISGTYPWNSSYNPDQFFSIAEDLTEGVDVEAHLDAISANLQLERDAFLEMTRIWKKDQDFDNGLSSEMVTAQEWDDFINILVSAVKKNRHADWMDEEASESIKLDPSVFWISQREPKEGNWPLIAEDGIPLIDPELVSLSHLPERPAGSLAIGMYNSRAAELLEIKDILLSPEYSSHSEDIIRFVFGVLMEIDDPQTSLGNLHQGINSIDLPTAEAAKKKVEAELSLSVEDFTLLMGIFNRMDQQGYQPNSEDRAYYVPLLVSAYKRLRLYPIWSAEESSYQGYRLRKAALPKWRASAQQRQAWQDALRRRGSIPVIDPDRVFAEDFLTYVSTESGYESYATWNTRRTELADLLEDITDITDANDLTQLQERITAVLGLTDFADYQEVLDLEEMGINVKSRLQQLGLSSTAYRRLNELLELAPTTANGLLDSEWDEANAILLDIAKRRRYAAWADQEAALGITLSQGFFKTNKDPFFAYSIVQERLPKHRATFKERNDWVKLLQGRIENVEKGILSLDHVVRKTEEETLPYLRDALIQNVGDNDLFLAENAENLTNKFYFDFKVNCCQEVTRVSQAMETLQMLLWSERTGVLEDNGENYALVAPHFEEEWKWIGSYATWRSAMFVFLFPENLLYPTLKRHQSPGFIKLSEKLRGSNRITPETACKAAHEYNEYLKDICNLKVQATCNTVTTMNAGNCNNGFVADERCLYYVFARAEHSGKIYYSIGKSQNWAVEGQGFWNELEAFGDKAVKVIGAVPWKHYRTSGSRYVYVFAIVREDDASKKLGFVRYNLDTQQWDSDEYEVLELPESVGDLSDKDIIVQQRNNEGIGPGILVMRAKSFKRTYLDIFETEYLSPCGNGLTEKHEWINEEWPYIAKILPFESSHFSGLSPVPNNDFATKSRVWLLRVRKQLAISETKLCATHLMHGSWWEETATILSYKGGLYLASSYFKMFGSIKLNLGVQGDVQFMGSTTYGYDSADEVADFETKGLTIIYRVVDTDEVKQLRIEFDNLQKTWPEFHQGSVEGWEDEAGWTIYAQSVVIQSYGNWVNLWIVKENLIPQGFQEALYVAPNWGIGLGGWKDDGLLHAYQWKLNPRIIRRFNMVHTVGTENGSELLVTPHPLLTVPINPQFSGPYGIVQSLTTPQLQLHRSLIETVYAANADGVAMRNEYIWEAFYFVPMYVALQLQQRGHYVEALDWFRTVYDFRHAQPDHRKIFHGLSLEESISGGYQLSANWLQDPLNPHGVALTRANSYTKYTLLAIIRCLEDYADAEFTIDTAETVPRARELYKEAIELLKLPELALLEDQCHCDSKVDEIIARVACELGPERLQEWRWSIELMEDDLQRIQSCGMSEATVDGIVDRIIDGYDEEGFDVSVNITEANEYLDNQVAIYEALTEDTIAEVIDLEYEYAEASMDRALSDPDVQAPLDEIAHSVGFDYYSSYVLIRGVQPEDAQGGEYEFLSEPYDAGKLPVNYQVGDHFFADTVYQNPQNPTVVGTMNLIGNSFIFLAAGLIQDYPEGQYVPILSNYFCVPDNPVINGLRMRAELNLFKIRNCMNIAGMTRSLDPYAAPTDTTSGVPVIGPGGQLSLPGSARIKPTPYRYQVIIERAKQLVSYAQQIEANFLAALEKRDAEYYNRMKAKQDLSMAKANVKLQKLRVKVAEGEVDLAELQRDRAQLQVDGLQIMIDEGLLGEEEALVGLFIAKGIHDIISSVLGTAMGAAQVSTEALTASVGIGAALTSASVYAATAAVKAGIDAASIGLGTSISITQLYASQARRAQEWNFQKGMAGHDVKIGNQSIKVAQSRLRVSGQEQQISEIQQDHAEATLDFLTTKFTNVDLYDFMSDTLEGVYSYFLQQATATAKMAMNQLAFERQELPPAFIVDDYWQVPTDSNAVATVGSNAPDRRGITGSARLLQDIIKLDQYSFDTDKRKLQMSKTFSLSNLAPIEFQQFKETGVITFQTMMEYFDRDFPGHYLRLIKKVKVNVIALTPPTDGIKATLTSSGTSRVTIGGDIFQTIVARRDPEMIALTGSRDATGMFEMQAENQFLNPFEGSGVDMLWELKMRKRSNLFNYDTIADVLITIDYTAFHSYNYEQQVLRQLPPFHSADRPFSFRSEMADQFYELGHPEPNADGSAPSEVEVHFDLSRGHFPPNIDYILTKEFKMLFVTNNETLEGSLEGEEVHFILNEVSTNGQNQGGTYTGTGVINGTNLISTAMGNGGLASALRNKTPFGRWSMKVSKELSDKIANEEVLDIMMVITYSGDYPQSFN